MAAPTDARREPAHIVGMGASAGGVDALLDVVSALPKGLDAAVCVVLHLPSSGRSLLAPILDRRSPLPVVLAADGAPLLAGRIYVAPADRHLTVSGGHVRLDRGPKENGVRPAVDPLLRSIAGAYGERAVAVVLSGALGDGSGGALAVRRAGGVVLVQDPEEAFVASMPESALRAVGKADAVLTAAAIGAALGALPARQTTDEEPTMPSPDISLEATRARPDGPPAALTCPECHGPIWETEDDGTRRYRCRVGHAFSEDSLVVEQGGAVEAALWSALEALEERAEFLARLAQRHGETRPRLRERYLGASRDASARAELLRSALSPRADGPDALDLQAEVQP